MSENTENLMPMNSETEKPDNDSGSSNVTTINKSRTKRNRAYRKLEKKHSRTRNITGLISLILIAGIGLSVVALKRVSNENKHLVGNLREAEHRIKNLHNEVQSLKLNNDTLVQGRIPGLTPLKFGEPYKLENQTLKSVVFTRTKHNNKILYEYLAVVHNTTQDVIRPSSLLIFFNKLGLEVGKGRVAINLSFDNEIKIISLQPGESHSYSGTIEMISEDEPYFFKLIEQ